MWIYCGLVCLATALLHHVLLVASVASKRDRSEANSHTSISSTDDFLKFDNASQPHREKNLDLSQSFDSDNCYESVSQPLKNPGIVLDKLPVTDLNEIGPSQALNLSHTSSEILSGSSSNYSDQLSRYHLRKRPKLNIVTENVALALDRTKTSSRSAAHILAAAASSFGYKLDDLNLSHSSIHRTRMKVRTEVAARLKKNLQVADHLTVHWDGKLLPESGVLKKMERVPVIVSGLNTEQLLNVPKFNKGSAINEAQGIADTIYEWNLNNRIKAMCFDTTPLNTGQKGGVCVLLEKKLGKKLLYFACRHHIFELVLRAVVEIYWPETTGPDMPTYKNFRRIWQEIDQSDFEIGFNDKLIRQVLKEDKDKILEFLQLRLKESQPRDDYKEFLELACIFLGGVPPKGIAFKVPGAVHHARWMAKAIYSLKMFMFKKQLGIQKVEIDGLRQICIFIIRFYVKPWFNAPNAIKAPNQDLTLLQSLIKYRKINAKISGAATSKLCAHLWYISEYLAPLAFFDDMVSNATKLKMIRAIKEREGTHPVPTRVIVKEADYLKVINKDISDFVTKNSLFLFEQYDLPYDFLEVSPELWKTEESYVKCVEVLQGLKVVNDTAERAVALVQDFNLLLTKDEDQRQYLLQAVKFYLKQYPTCQKRNLTLLL